jgi:hypothetical protein
MKYVTIAAAILIFIPFVLKWLIKAINKFVKITDNEIADFNDKLKFIENNEGLKKIYRNYLFINYILMFILVPVLVIPLAFVFPESTKYLPIAQIIILILLFLLSCVSTIGVSMLFSAVIIYILNFILNIISNKKIDLKYYDTFSLNVNKSLESIWPESKKMRSLKYLKFSKLTAYFSTAIYFLIIVVFLLLKNFNNQ